MLAKNSDDGTIKIEALLNIFAKIPLAEFYSLSSRALITKTFTFS